MNRLDNWQERLSNVIRARREAGFAWGTADCTQFAFNAVKAVIGEDMGKPYRGKYTTAAGALKILQKVGGVKQPADLFAARFGKRKAIAFARKGDVVTCSPALIGLSAQAGAGAFGPVIGVCYGHMSYFVAEQGLIEIETLQCSGCFHVLKVPPAAKPRAVRKK